MRSVVDDYLPAEGRENQRAGHEPLLNADQIAGVRMKARAARALPLGLRVAALERVGREYGIGLRTVQRYADSRTVEVEIDGWRARFTVTDNRPRQSSSWERA